MNSVDRIEVMMMSVDRTWVIIPWTSNEVNELYGPTRGPIKSSTLKGLLNDVIQFGVTWKSSDHKGVFAVRDGSEPGTDDVTWSKVRRR